MAIVINREIAGDLNNPSAELLNYCMEQHLNNKERFEKLANYYDGKQDILNRKKEDDSAPNNKIMVNHAKYVVDMNVGFMVGNPIAYSTSDDNDISAILKEYDRIDIVSHDTELEKDLSTFGIGYELIYLRKGSKSEIETNIRCVDPRGIFLVTDDTIDKKTLFAVHVQPVYGLGGGIDHYLYKYYNDTRVITYISDTEGQSDYTRVKTLPHYFGRVPVIEYRNNEEKQGDFEQAISLIDAYNLLQSDRLNDKEAFVDAILFIQGFMLDEDDGRALMEERMLQVTGKPSETAAGYLTKELDENNVSMLRDALLDDFHKVTYVPNMNDENFAGNVSGEAMKYKLFGLLQLMSVKSRYMIKGLRQRLEIFANIQNLKGPKVDVTGVTIKLKPNLPINTSDIINQIVLSYNAGILPLKVLLGWLPDINDVDKVIEQLNFEKEEKIELQKKAMGVQAGDSHSDLDDPSEKNEKENNDE